MKLSEAQKTEYFIDGKWTTKVPKKYVDKLLKTRQVPNPTPNPTRQVNNNLK